MRVSCRNNDAVIVDNAEVKDVVLHLSGSYQGWKQARTAFPSLHRVWTCSKNRTKNEGRIFNTDVAAALPSYAELLRTAVSDKKLAAFHCENTYRGSWGSARGRLKYLYVRAQSIPLAVAIIAITMEVDRPYHWRGGRRWIGGDVLRREANDNIKVTLTWSPEGKDKTEEDRRLLRGALWGK